MGRVDHLYRLEWIINQPFAPSILQNVAAAEPGVLIMPEHSNLQYYGFSAPYHQLNQGAGATPAQVRQAYSHAFSIINVADAPIATNYQSLLNAVAHGDVLMFRAWFDDP